jgi:hypothetical protein
MSDVLSSFCVTVLCYMYGPTVSDQLDHCEECQSCWFLHFIFGLLRFKAGTLAVCLPYTAKEVCTDARDMKTEVWNAMPCGWARMSRRFVVLQCLHLETAWPWRLRHWNTSKHRDILVEWQGLTSPKTWILRNATVRTSNLARNKNQQDSSLPLFYFMA